MSDPSYLVKGRPGGPYLFRTTIPKFLRPKFGQACEVRLSLGTGIENEARKLAAFLQVYAEEVYRRAPFYEGTLEAEAPKRFLQNRLAELDRASHFPSRTIPLLAPQMQWGYTQPNFHPGFQPVAPNWMSQDTSNLQVFSPPELFGADEGQGFTVQLLKLVLPKLESEELAELLEANNLLALIGVKTRKQAREIVGMQEIFLKVVVEQDRTFGTYAGEFRPEFLRDNVMAKLGFPNEIIRLARLHRLSNE